MKRVRFGLLAASSFVVVTAITLFWLYSASQSVPDFYARTLPFEAARAAEAGKQAEREVLELHNDLERGARWELTLSDEQVNGWLVSDLQQKFPHTLPDDVHDPRVVFEDGKILIACRLESHLITTVLSLALEPYLTDDPQQIAVRITRLRAGRLPLPLKGILDRVSAASAASELDLQWSQDGGDPVAVIHLSNDQADPQQKVAVESLQVSDGRLRVRGRLLTATDLDVPR